MKLSALFFTLLTATACGHVSTEAAMSHQDPLIAGPSIAQQMRLSIPACAILKAKIETTHQEAVATPQWQALAQSGPWQHYKQCKEALKACQAQNKPCETEQASFDAAWQAIEDSDVFAEANTTPEAQRLSELMAEAVELHCWDDEVSQKSAPNDAPSLS